MRSNVVEQPAIILLTMLIFKAEMHETHLGIINEKHSPVMLGWSFGDNCDQDCSEYVTVHIYGCWCLECSWRRDVLLLQEWKYLPWFIWVHIFRPYLHIYCMAIWYGLKIYALSADIGIDSGHVLFPTIREHWEVKKNEFRNLCGLSELKAALQQLLMRTLVIHISAVSWESSSPKFFKPRISFPWIL